MENTRRRQHGLQPIIRILYLTKTNIFILFSTIDLQVKNINYAICINAQMTGAFNPY